MFTHRIVMFLLGSYANHQENIVFVIFVPFVTS